MRDQASRIVISGQGLMGSCLAWTLLERGADFILLDKESPKSSSLVAAGLINPITGANFNKSWEIDEYLPQSRSFFEDKQNLLDCVFWHSLDLVRLLPEGKRREKVFRKWKAGEFDPYVKGLVNLDSKFYCIEEGVLLGGAARVDVRLFVEETKSFFVGKGMFQTDSSIIHSGDLVVRAHGAVGLLKGEMSPLPHRCAKGEILTIKAPDLPQEYTIIDQGWLIPLGDSLFRVGATYQWDDLDYEPTQEGEAFVERWMEKHINCDWVLVDHQVGIRPIVRQSKPLIDHEDHTWTVNGLGSKGALYAPRVAEILADCILDQKPIPENLDAKIYQQKRGI